MSFARDRIEEAWIEGLTRGYVGLLCENDDPDNPFGPRFWEPNSGGYARVRLTPLSFKCPIEFPGGTWRGRFTHAGLFDTMEPRTGTLTYLTKLDFAREKPANALMRLDLKLSLW